MGGYQVRLDNGFSCVLVVLVAVCASGCEKDLVRPNPVASIGVVRQWKAAMPATASREAGSNALSDSATFYFVASNGKLVAARRSDGSLLWESPGARLSARNTVRSGGVVSVGASATLYGTGTDDGVSRWSVDLGFPSADNCVTSATATVVIACTPDWKVFAIDAVSGAVRWTVTLRDSLNGLPTLIGTAVSGDTVYAVVKQLYSTTVGYAQGLFFALSLADGHVLSLTRDGNYTDFSGYVGTLAIVGRILVVPHLIANKLTGIDRFTSQVAWRVNGDAGWAGFVEVPTVVDGVLYAASADRRVYAIRATTGGVEWKSDILEGSQLIAAACGNVVATWTGSNVRILDRATGRYLGIINDEMPDGTYGITSPPYTDGKELFLRSQKEYRKYSCP